MGWVQPVWHQQVQMSEDLLSIYYADDAGKMAFMAIFNAPSRVWLPPMKPLACTTNTITCDLLKHQISRILPNIQSGIPVQSLNCWSRKPRQDSGSGCRDSKDPGEMGTA